jgi:hypothetical protein
MSGVTINYQSGSRLDVLNLVDESQVRQQASIEIVDPNTGAPTYPFRYQGFSKQVSVTFTFQQSPRLYISLEDLEYSNNGITVEGVVTLASSRAIPYTHHIVYAQTAGGTFLEQNFNVDVSHPDYSTVFYTASDTGLVNVDTSTNPNTLEIKLPLLALTNGATRIYDVQGLIKVWEGLDRSSL